MALSYADVKAALDAVSAATGGKFVPFNAAYYVANYSVVKDANGNWGEQTEWHTVVCFGRTAELAGQYLQKGRRIFVEGRLQTRSWDDRDGKKQYRTEVVAEEVKFLDSRGGESRGGYGGGERPAYEGDPGPDDGGYGAGGDDDDIPF